MRVVLWVDSLAAHLAAKLVSLTADLTVARLVAYLAEPLVCAKAELKVALLESMLAEHLAVSWAVVLADRLEHWRVDGTVEHSVVQTAEHWAAMLADNLADLTVLRLVVLKDDWLVAESVARSVDLMVATKVDPRVAGTAGLSVDHLGKRKADRWAADLAAH